MSKVSLVIGGLRGIGMAISEDLVRHGFTVFATTRNRLEHSDLGGIVPIQMDLMKVDEVSNAVRTIEKQCDSLDLLVNNAGVGIFKPFEEFSFQELEKVFQTNVLGLFNCTQKCFPLLKKNGGRIINISSIATERNLPFNSVYAASKHALRGFGGVMSEEWHQYGILTTNIHLGATYTDIWKGVEGFSKEDMLQVDDVARVISFIATTPSHVRMDDMTLTPKKGVL